MQTSFKYGPEGEDFGERMLRGGDQGAAEEARQEGRRDPQAGEGATQAQGEIWDLCTIHAMQIYNTSHSAHDDNLPTGCYMT